jgi:hypothetical protein
VADKVFAAERTRQAIAAAEGEVGRHTLLSKRWHWTRVRLAWLWFAAVTDDPGEENAASRRSGSRPAAPGGCFAEPAGWGQGQAAAGGAPMSIHPTGFITGYADESGEAGTARRHLVVVGDRGGGDFGRASGFAPYVAVMADNLLSQGSGREAILAAWAAEN